MYSLPLPPASSLTRRQISGDISDITILMTESQFHLLRGVMEENICAAKGPTEPSGGFEQTPPKPHSVGTGVITVFLTIFCQQYCSCYYSYHSFALSCSIRLLRLPVTRS